jgi:hypothetical protein
LRSVVFAADIALHEHAAQFLRECRARILIEVGNDDLAALCGEQARSGGAVIRNTLSRISMSAPLLQFSNRHDRISFRWSIVTAVLQRGKKKGGWLHRSGAWTWSEI